jgi:hypothetical protein
LPSHSKKILGNNKISLLIGRFDTPANKISVTRNAHTQKSRKTRNNVMLTSNCGQIAGYCMRSQSRDLRLEGEFTSNVCFSCQQPKALLARAAVGLTIARARGPTRHARRAWRRAHEDVRCSWSRSSRSCPPRRSTSGVTTSSAPPNVHRRHRPRPRPGVNGDGPRWRRR